MGEFLPPHWATSAVYLGRWASHGSDLSRRLDKFT
jgi:hypothetical protein